VALFCKEENTEVTISSPRYKNSYTPPPQKKGIECDSPRDPSAYTLVTNCSTHRKTFPENGGMRLLPVFVASIFKPNRQTGVGFSSPSSAVLKTLPRGNWVVIE
jgi:hypothetical protein